MTRLDLLFQIEFFLRTRRNTVGLFGWTLMEIIIRIFAGTRMFGIMTWKRTDRCGKKIQWRKWLLVFAWRRTWSMLFVFSSVIIGGVTTMMASVFLMTMSFTWWWPEMRRNCWWRRRRRMYSYPERERLRRVVFFFFCEWRTGERDDDLDMRRFFLALWLKIKLTGFDYYFVFFDNDVD